MSRHLQLVRLILQKIEGTEPVDLSEYTDEEADMALEEMTDAGLVKCDEPPLDAFPSAEEYIAFMEPRITMRGRAFLLETKEHPSVWRSVLGKAQSAGGALALTAATEFMKAELRKHGVIQ